MPQSHAEHLPLSVAGRASVTIHHGEILQGVFRHEGGLRRGLVTLPCRMHAVRAAFTPNDAGAVTVSPPWKTKARRAAELALTALGIPAGGNLVLSDDVPVGRGFGSSTADVVAAIGAVRDAFARPLSHAKDVALLGEVATAGTRINHKHLPIPRFEQILAVAGEVGATGVQTAHSGDIAGLIFDSADPEIDTRTAHGAKLLRDIGITERWEFEVDG